MNNVTISCSECNTKYKLISNSSAKYQSIIHNNKSLHLWKRRTRILHCIYILPSQLYIYFVMFYCTFYLIYLFTLQGNVHQAGFNSKYEQKYIKYIKSCIFVVF